MEHEVNAKKRDWILKMRTVARNESIVCKGDEAVESVVIQIRHD